MAQSGYIRQGYKKLNPYLFNIINKILTQDEKLINLLTIAKPTALTEIAPTNISLIGKYILPFKTLDNFDGEVNNQLHVYFYQGDNDGNNMKNLVLHVDIVCNNSIDNMLLVNGTRTAEIMNVISLAVNKTKDVGLGEMRELGFKMITLQGVAGYSMAFQVLSMQ